MFGFLRHYARWQGFLGYLNRLPPSARFVVGLAALPGLLLVLLSILGFLVSLLALFLITVPVYRMVNWLVGTAPPPQTHTEVTLTGSPFAADAVVQSPAVVDLSPPRPRRHIDVRIVE